MPNTPPVPTRLGYRMPAEWEPHAATWLSWPHRDGISFPGSYDQIVPVLARMIDALADSEPVCVNVRDGDQEAFVRQALAGLRAEHVRFYHIPTNEPWCRDHGPMFIVRDKDASVAVIDWGYNAWGYKYPPFDLDDAVPTRVAEELGLPLFNNPMVLEGGSIDVNGCGALLTTKSCLLNPNRNPELSLTDIERNLQNYLGVRNILWLGDGIEGDDTDGHVDDITRFVGRNDVITVVEDDEHDANFEPLNVNLCRLKEMSADGDHPLVVHPMPMPSRIIRQGQRLPASYANFYIANHVVLMPAFADANDNWASTILQTAFPTRRVVPIDCRELIWGLGAFHCLTQQQPAPPVSHKTRASAASQPA